MKAFVRAASLAAVAVLAPALAFAQASIAGVVKDTSGAVLPGVTVEVASPALIEKTRSSVSSGTGQYEITALLPGVYSITFTLPGFNTVKRDGIELTGSFAAKIDAEMRVGAVEETITVTGASPIVDVDNANRQTALGREVLDTIPAGRNPYMIAVMIPGMTTNNAIQDVGGAESRGGTQPGNTSFSIHGGRTNDQIYLQNGVSAVDFENSFINILIPNPGGTEEIVVDTAAASVEHFAGGVRMNIITRDGGNVFHGTFLGTFANGAFQSSNLDADLRKAGLTTGEGVRKLSDINPGIGGPLRRDKLWFYFSFRRNEADSWAPNAYYNLNTNKPDVWTYAPDLSKPQSNDVHIKDGQLRLTWQATPKNKIGMVWHEQINCYCQAGISALNSLETSISKSMPLTRSVALDWTLPSTNRLLVEAGAFYFVGTTNWNPWPGLARGMIAVTDQATGMSYRSGDAGSVRQYGNRPMLGLHSRAAVSYITGTHQFKVGLNDSSGNSSFYTQRWMPLKYRLNNGIPNQITQYAFGGENDPLPSKSHLDLPGIFAQDKWRTGQLTTSYGVRVDWVRSRFPEQHVTPSLYAPTRNIVFPKQDNLHWTDVTPRFAAVYDLFGNGKTGLKASLGKYLENMGAFTGIANGANPTQTLVTTASRSWTDANGNFIPDCNLISPAAQDLRGSGGDVCGALSNQSFGGTQPGARYDSDLTRGFGKRAYNWEFGAGVQHELFPRVAVDVSYFRRWYGNFRVTDNLTLAAADYDTYSILAPSDPRLPDGGGYRVVNLIDLKPAKFGLPTDNFNTLASNYGKQTEHWQGIDATINARLRDGLLLQGGVSSGRTVTDSCEIDEKVPETRTSSFCHIANAWMGGTQVKFLGSYAIPRIDVRFGLAFQNIPGQPISANYNAPNAVVQPSLGRPLAGGAANATVNLITPGTLYGDRINQTDLRFAKVFRFSGLTTTINADLYNAFNANPVLTQNFAFGNNWLQPTNILQARFLKLGLQVDF